jgi:Leucine-rich repeat (LRR) protein
MGANNKINWLNIIINSEFQNYLDEESVKEISISSKSIREKLKPLIFNKLKISNSILDYSKKNIITDHYKYYHYSNFDNSACKDSNIHGTDSILNDFTVAFTGIKKFVKCLHFCDFNRPGLYIFPITGIFKNLIKLELGFNVMIPYSGFAKLGESLPNLNHVKLCAVLVKLPTEHLSPEDYIFPPNLKYLEIVNNNIISTSSISDPYKFLFDRDSSDLTIEFFKIPKVSLPSLNELVYFDSMRPDLGLKDFLEVNSNLESLSIRSSNLKSISTLTSLKKLKLDGEIIFNNSSQFPALKSLECLHIACDFESDWEITKRLCDMCENLSCIEFVSLYSIMNFQDLIDTELVPIVSNLPHLKVVKLDITIGDDSYLNFSKFSNIETLILISQDEVILNLNFINCKKLKKVVFESKNYEINTKEFKDKFGEYNNWKFKFSDLTIKGYKINE